MVYVNNESMIAITFKGEKEGCSNYRIGITEKKLKTMKII